jgi:hypothetical protein
MFAGQQQVGEGSKSKKNITTSGVIFGRSNWFLFGEVVIWPARQSLFALSIGPFRVGGAAVARVQDAHPIDRQIEVQQVECRLRPPVWRHFVAGQPFIEALLHEFSIDLKKTILYGFKHMYANLFSNLKHHIMLQHFSQNP